MYNLYREIDDNPFCVDWAETDHDSQFADLLYDLNLFEDTYWVYDTHVNTICSWDTVEHLWNATDLFLGASVMLESGGYLLLASPFLYWIHESPHDYHRYTEYALRKYCSLAELEVIECEPYGNAADVLMDMQQKTGFGMLTKPIAHLNRFPLGYTLVARRA